MLMGEYHHNIDDKNRLIIPSKFREELGNEFVITRGLDGCLFVYSMDEWNKVMNKLKTLPFTKKDARTFMRFMLSAASICEFDKQGRINLVNSLINYAEIKKECVIIGVNDRLEIWAVEKFNELLSNSEELSLIAENLFDGGYEDVA
ncbi:MAG: division/cell wall cluster transcriptional repressor MraZ [Bacilli bacterium]|nr:division/cell wall cluster transcriptional repressor MraZ [Bacilli bacterium]